MTVALLLSALLLPGQTAPLCGAGASVVEVSKTFDDVPFRYRMELSARRGGYRAYRLTYPSPVVTAHEPNNTIAADYFLPNGVTPGDPRRPAVICLHILDGDFVLAELVCSYLALRGIPAMTFKLPYYGERSLPAGPKALASDPDLFFGALDQTVADMQRTIDVLASRPEVDGRRLGITGISLGGIVAAMAAGAEPRLSRAVLLLAGGDLMHIVHHARETAPLADLIRRLPPEQQARLEAKVASVDPLRFAPRLRDRAQSGKVLMINAAEDEVVPRACTEKLAAALGIADRVVWLEGLGHYSAVAELPRALRATGDFFAKDLPEGLQPNPPRRDAAFEAVVSLLRQAAEMLSAEPPPGRCHAVDVAITATPKDSQPVEARLRLLRGSARKFKLHAELPGVGKITFGQGGYPWLATGEAAVLKGMRNPGAALRHPLALAGQEHLLSLRIAAGALGGVVMSPGVLRRWITLDSNGDVLLVRCTAPLNGQLTLKREDSTSPFRPHVAQFEMGDVAGAIQFHQWQTGAPCKPSTFDPSADAASMEVDESAVYGALSAALRMAF